MDLQAIISTVVRHGLSLLGAALVAKGYLGADDATAIVEQLSGVVLAVGMAVWSYIRTTKLKNK